MHSIADRPIAVRAAAVIRPSRWLRRPVRMIRHDARWADSRVEAGVNLARLMYRRSPADFAVLAERVHDECPEVGTGRWVDEIGRVVDGPVLSDPISPTGRGMQRRAYGSERTTVNPRVVRAWRLGGGLVGLALGILLVTGPAASGFTGFTGFLGVVCSLGGLASLAGLIPRRHRWW